MQSPLRVLILVRDLNSVDIFLSFLYIHLFISGMGVCCGFSLFNFFLTYFS